MASFDNFQNTPIKKLDMGKAIRFKTDQIPFHLILLISAKVTL
jgi:hypothetical protein